MAKVEPFEKHPDRYEAWFEKNRFVYESELRAVRGQVPQEGAGLEVGAGSGRFAGPLGIRLGIDPSAEMRKLARSRGMTVLGGVAEDLPFRDGRFDFVLMVTAICFFEDVQAAFKESYRVLKPHGILVVGFIDGDSPVGREYRKGQQKSTFYREAVFFTAKEVASHLKKADFTNLSFKQTVFSPLDRIRKVEPVKNGHGEGSFVVVKAHKTEEIPQKM
ncbi:MAG: class I SAM-dependent methyltransferase [Candidatus Aminicenantes bacterium]|nr:class I SAM-dependent methyltransferase [Candidatus Aminicenantes bacterium]